MRYLTFNRLGDYGRLGNQLWEVAAVLGLAKKHNVIPLIPYSWQHREHCNLPLDFYGDKIADTVVKEKQHHYDPDILNDVKGEIVTLEGCFQSPKYFAGMEDQIKEWLRPKESLNFGEWSVGVHIRRGDYVGNPGYCQYEIDWYKAVMDYYFSDPRYIFYICSDDYKYITKHFPSDERHIFAKRSPVDDLAALSSCKHFILSGSSFSFWAAYLSTQPGGTIVRPPRTHTGHLSHLIETDIWPDNFIPFTPQNKVFLCCYADKNYEKLQDRLVKTNEHNKQFDEVFKYDRAWLESTDFYAQHKDILDQPRGGGFWLWKPFLILETLKKIKENDILLYMDSGDIFFGDIRKYLLRELADKNIILTEGGNIQKDYTKRDCFIEMDCDGTEYHNAQQIEAGIIGMKNTAKTRYILKEWLGWCTKAHVIDDSPNVLGENFPTYISHRHDQSILNNLRVLHSLFAGAEIRGYTACNVMEPTEGKIDLSDCTFVIPVRWDSSDRQENVELVIDWLQHNFTTNIILGEQGSNREFQYLEKKGIRYVYFDYDHFHRTRMLNEMFLMSTTEIIFNHDGDVLLMRDAIEETVRLLRAGHPFVYPYSGDFVHVPRMYYKILKELKAVESIRGVKLKGYGDASVGGSVAFLRKPFLDAGFENENMHGHSPEDRCRAKRMGLFGGYCRVSYPLFHMEHFIGPDSSHATNDYAAFNNGEWRRIRAIKTREDMQSYVDTWQWKREYIRKLES